MPSTKSLTGNRISTKDRSNATREQHVSGAYGATQQGIPLRAAEGRTRTITPLSAAKAPQTVSKLGKQMKNITLVGTNISNTQKMVDTDTKKLIHYVSLCTKILPDKNYFCWWCTLSIQKTSDILGCPIDIKISNNEKQYATNGLFCSFNCIKAFVLETKDQVKYKNSIQYLAQMYCDMYNIEPIVIKPSPPWEFLTKFGGYMSENQYRDHIGKYTYVIKGVIQKYPITTLYEEQEKLL